MTTAQTTTQDEATEQYAEVIVNWGDGKEQKPELVPPGNHRGEIFDVIYGESKSSGSPMFTVIVRLSDAPVNGRRLTTYFPLSQGAIWKLREFLLSLHMPAYTAETLNGEQAILPEMVREDLLNQEVIAQVVHEPYLGQPSAKIKKLTGAAAWSAPAGNSDDELPF